MLVSYITHRLIFHLPERTEKTMKISVRKASLLAKTKTNDIQNVRQVIQPLNCGTQLSSPSLLLGSDMEGIYESAD